MTGQPLYVLVLFFMGAGWGLTVPLAWWVGMELELGVVGAWMALCASMATLTVVLLWRFASGAWRHIRI